MPVVVPVMTVTMARAASGRSGRTGGIGRRRDGTVTSRGVERGLRVRPQRLSTLSHIEHDSHGEQCEKREQQRVLDQVLSFVFA